MSYISTIDTVVYGVEDLDKTKRFFSDWGLSLVSFDKNCVVFETQEKSRVIIRHKDDPSLPPAIEEGSTVREVIWGMKTKADLDSFVSEKASSLGLNKDEDGIYRCVDPNGLSLGFNVTSVKPLDIKGTQSNAYGVANRVDEPAPTYARAQPMRLAHVVFFVDDLAACETFYIDELGFNITDEYTDRGFFSRCVKEGTHHNLFLLKTPPNRSKGVNHVSFGVRDIYEVTGGGIHMDKSGWSTAIGPGRHPISSAFFWYFISPGGGLVEYYADEDYLTEKWQYRTMTPSPELFAEWAVADGISHNTRRQNKRK